MLFRSAAAQTLVAVGPDCDPARAMAFLRRGASVAVIESQPDGRLSIRALLDHLGKLGILRVLCEGGAELAASLLDARAADELLFFYAPRILGGRSAVPAVGGPGRALDSALGYRITEAWMAGRDLAVRARPD